MKYFKAALVWFFFKILNDSDYRFFFLRYNIKFKHKHWLFFLFRLNEILYLMFVHPTLGSIGFDKSESIIL
jgi:hypothetical protein